MELINYQSFDESYILGVEIEKSIINRKDKKMKKYNVNINISIAMEIEVVAKSKKEAKEMCETLINNTNILDLKVPKLVHKNFQYEIKKSKCEKK